MPSVAEATNGAGAFIESALDAGIDTISLNQTITFQRYVRCVTPVDGFVFWINAALASSTTEAQLKGYQESVIEAAGSLHYATDQRQNETDTLGVNRVVFTAKQRVQAFNEVASDTIYIGEFENIRFAFTGQKNFYEQAGIYHYIGDAIYPAMESQIIDDIDDIDLTNLVVSNSLPVWLTLNRFFPIYGSFLVPENIRPPYAVAHIRPDDTWAIGSAPRIDKTGTHTQLTRDLVRITTYGVRNDAALDFQDYVFQYSLDTDVIGIMNTPVFRDMKRTQSELNILAMEKTIEIEISYYQARVANITRQLILSSVMAFIANPL